jgi:glycosyltransferase involved in cell wall biosynthesis
VLTLHGSEILNFTRWPHRRALLNRVLGKAEVVGVVSRFTRELLLERTSVSRTKVKIFSGALRSDFPEKLPPTRARPDGELVVLSVARIHPRKGQLELLEALAGLPEALRQRTVVQFAGRSVREGYRLRLEGFARTQGLRVEFIGEKRGADIWECYANATIFALTSLWTPGSFESFGMVYLEAGACGLPVLAHDTGGVSDAVIDGETGLLVPTGKPQALSAALRRLLEDGELRRRLGENGRRHARSFSWAQNAARLFPV